MLFTFGILAVYRVGGHITTPGINIQALNELTASAASSNLFGLYDMFSGYNLSQMTVFALGIMPYISASIILQLLTVVWPYLERLSKEGELGRRKITQYTRYGTILLSVVQSLAIAIFLENAGQTGGYAIVDHPGWGFRLMTVLTLTTGSVLVMWLGEQITERGIGNGMSLLIYAGIVVGFPRGVVNTLTQMRLGEIGLFTLVALVVLMVVVVGAVVFVERGHRRVTVQYARRMVGRRMYGGASTHIPLKVNTGGVMPVIFASSILAFPQTIKADVPGQRLRSTGRCTQLSIGYPLYNLFYVGADHLLRVLLHGDHLQSGRRGGEHAEVRRVRAGHPARQADRRAHRQHPGAGDAGRRRLPGRHRAAAGVAADRIQGRSRFRSSATAWTRFCRSSSPRA